MRDSVVLQFQNAGAELCRERLVSSHGGNLSVRAGDRMLVTRHGCGLRNIVAGDVVEADIGGDGTGGTMESMETPVHRAIYLLTDAGAVVHAHPAHAIALSLKTREIVPPDVEGSIILGKVPVVGWEETLLPGRGGEVVARALAGRNAVMVRGHGCFTIGPDLETACCHALLLEESCRIHYLAHNLERWDSPT